MPPIVKIITISEAHPLGELLLTRVWIINKIDKENPKIEKIIPSSEATLNGTIEYPVATIIHKFISLKNE